MTPGGFDYSGVILPGFELQTELQTARGREEMGFEEATELLMGFSILVQPLDQARQRTPQSGWRGGGRLLGPGGGVVTDLGGKFCILWTRVFGEIGVGFLSVELWDHLRRETKQASDSLTSFASLRVREGW